MDDANRTQGPIADRRLAVYGTLAPGRPNHHLLAPLGGRWREGQVQGRLVASGWGATLGYPALALDPNGQSIAVHVLDSEDLPTAWPWLDRFEGPGYRRVVTTVRTADGDIDASIYVAVSDCPV